MWKFHILLMNSSTTTTCAFLFENINNMYFNIYQLQPISILDTTNTPYCFIKDTMALAILELPNNVSTLPFFLDGYSPNIFI